ncbi:MAG: HD domain-containing protein [Kiritimatiellae bacterium]|nr:HD domain-containing protein [Kiritimatiellia bacterium]MDD5520030.1 HD domain-containing protein [Kiritimatiellia bacterium]
MNQQELAQIRKWYMYFADKYRAKDGSMHLVLQLKFDHSQRVAADCREIATELGWPDYEITTAEVIGLLHDVSRFPQFAEYKTFLDHRSFDHGERGYRIVSEAGIMSPLNGTEQAEILNSIRYHNRRNIDVELDPDCLRFLKLIRDADKLDILEVVYDTIKNNRHKDYPEILCHVNPDGPATPELIAEIRKYGYGSFEYVKSMTDMNLMRMTWVYNINYLPALRRLSERRLLEHLDETMLNDPDVEDLMRKARRFVNRETRNTEIRQVLRSYLLIRRWRYALSIPASREALETLPSFLFKRADM